ncbi:MAG: GyrI-like domain-containing protein [Myxococcaceae bacterium]
MSFLEGQKEVIAQKLERYAQVHRALETLVRQEKEAAMVTTHQKFQIEVKTVAEQLVAGIRGKGRYTETGARLGKVARAAGRHIAGAPLGLYYDGEYKEEDADFESCFPIKGPVKKEGIEVHTLEGGRCVSFVHQGPYSELGRSYQRVFEYLREKKLEPKLPTREVYLKGPGMIFKGNPKKYLTEIQVLIAE